MLNATPPEQPEAPSPSDFRGSAQQQVPTNPSTQIDWALVAENLQLQSPEVMVQEESVWVLSLCIALCADILLSLLREKSMVCILISS